MKACWIWGAALVALFNVTMVSAKGKAAVYPMALLTFDERGAGAKEMGPKVTDVLFAKLAARPEVYMVDRTDMKKMLDEQALNLSGAVRPDEATKVGQLTGAKLLVTGSVVQVDKNLHLVAKIISTETSRVLAASVEGKASDELGPLVGKLADQIATTLADQSDDLVPAAEKPQDRLESLSKQLKKGKKPTVFVQIAERHVGLPAFDPAAQTEMVLFCRGTNFDVVDGEAGTPGAADVLIQGEALSELAGRVGGLVSVKARVEIKAVDRKSGKVIAADRQTALVVDLTEQIAGKSALQEAAAQIAERLLPKIAEARD